MVRRKRIWTYEPSDSEDDEVKNLTAKQKASKSDIKKKTKRVAAECPVCSARTVQLPRHMNRIHGVPKHIAKYTRLQYNMRKDTKKLQNPKCVDYHVRRKCPVPNCVAIVKRLPRHLQSVHKMSAADQIAAFGKNCGIPVDKRPRKTRTKARQTQASQETMNDCSINQLEPEELNAVESKGLTPSNISRGDDEVKNPAAKQKASKSDIIKKTKRNATECPVCSARTVHLPRHMNQIHGVPKHIARYTRSQYNMQKDTKKLQNPKYVDYHVRKKCPVPNCVAIVKRISLHLQSVHKMSVTDQIAAFGKNCGIPVDKTPRKTRNKARQTQASQETMNDCSINKLEPEELNAVENKGPTPSNISREDDEVKNPAAKQKASKSDIIKKTKRNATECPVCFARTVHLPRHMNQIHGVPKHIARYTRSQYNMRKDTKKLQNPKYVDYHVRKKCPVPNCVAIVKRISLHLQSVHKMSVTDQIAAFGKNCGIPVDKTPRKTRNKARQTHSSQETVNDCSINQREPEGLNFVGNKGVTPSNTSMENSSSKLVCGFKTSAMVNKERDAVNAQKKFSKDSCQSKLQDCRRSARVRKRVTIIGSNYEGSEIGSVKDSDNDPKYSRQIESCDEDNVNNSTNVKVTRSREILSEVEYHAENSVNAVGGFATLLDQQLGDDVYSNLNPKQEAPVLSHPVQEAPVLSHPVQEALVHSHPVQEALVHSHPVQEAPVHSHPVQEAPMHSHPVQEAPVHSHLVDDVSTPADHPLDITVDSKLNSNELEEFVSDEWLNNCTDVHKPWTWLKPKIILWMQLKTLDASTIANTLRRIELLFKENSSEDYRRLLNINKAVALIKNINKQNINDPNSSLTKIKYVCALKHLARYFLANPKVDVFCNPLKMQSYLQSLSDFLCPRRKAAMCELWRENKRDNTLISIEDCIGQYLSCEFRALVKKKILDMATSEPLKLTADEYILILGYLYLEISFENANRACEARNMTVPEYLNAIILADDSMVVHAEKHESYRVFHASPVVISPELAKEIKIYKEKIRKTSAAEPCNNLFTSSDGTTVPSGNMSRIMRSFWVSAGIPGKMGAPLLREASATYVKRNASTLASKLALKIQHGIETRGKFNYVEDEMQKAVEGSSQQRKLHDTQQENISSGKLSGFPKVSNSQELNNTTELSNTNSVQFGQNSEEAIIFGNFADNSNKADGGHNIEALSEILMSVPQCESSQQNFLDMQPMTEQTFLLQNETGTHVENSHDLNQFTMPEADGGPKIEALSEIRMSVAQGESSQNCLEMQPMTEQTFSLQNESGTHVENSHDLNQFTMPEADGGRKIEPLSEILVSVPQCESSQKNFLEMQPMTEETFSFQNETGTHGKSHMLNEFTMPEECVLYEAFAGLIQKRETYLLNASIITYNLSKSEAGKEILSKFDVVKIYNKIKYYKKREPLGKNFELISRLTSLQNLC